MASNWDTITEIPPWDHPVINSGHISLELVPINPEQLALGTKR